MRTQVKRLEMLENFSAGSGEWYSITQDYDNKELYYFKNKETGETETMTLQEAEDRFENLIVINYVKNWNERKREYDSE